MEKQEIIKLIENYKKVYEADLNTNLIRESKELKLDADINRQVKEEIAEDKAVIKVLNSIIADIKLG